jgi:hypothetical protein
MKSLTVNVVNSYAPTLDSVFVVLDSKVDLPTEGKPIKHTRASDQAIDKNPSALLVLPVRTARF